MKLRKSLLSIEEVVALYRAKSSIKHIQKLAGISRPAVYAILNDAGVKLGRREVLTLTCRFCGETYDKPRSHVKGEQGGYCSVQCFHADRSLIGEYSKVGGAMARLKLALGTECDVTDRSLGRRAAKILNDAGIKLKRGEVVHHKNGDRRDYSLENLQVFKNHSEHMKFHHSLRGKK